MISLSARAGSVFSGSCQYKVLILEAALYLSLDSTHYSLNLKLEREAVQIVQYRNIIKTKSYLVENIL